MNQTQQEVRSGTAEHPPLPPAFDRQFQLHPYQYIGIPLLFVIPILTLLGFFGQTLETKQALNDVLAVQVTYTTRVRYTNPAPMSLDITNRTAAPLSHVTVALDRAYMDGFDDLNILPAPTMMTDSAILIDLTDLQAGQTQRIAVEIKAGPSGVYAGTITVSADGNVLKIPIETLSFP